MRKNERGTSIINLILIILIFICITFIVFSFIETKEISVINEPENNESVLINKIKKNETTPYTNVAIDNSVESGNNNQINDSLQYYFSQLNPTGKELYDTIVHNIDAFENGKKTIEFDVDSSDAGSYFQSAWDAFILDRPEIFWVDTTKVSWTTRTITTITGVNYKYTLNPKDGETYFINSFKTKEEVKSAIDKVNNKIKEIVDGASRKYI